MQAMKHINPANPTVTTEKRVFANLVCTSEKHIATAVTAVRIEQANIFKVNIYLTENTQYINTEDSEKSINRPDAAAIRYFLYINPVISKIPDIMINTIS